MKYDSESWHVYVQDESGHDYIIPLDLKDEWIELSDEIERLSIDDRNRWDLENQFEKKFREYRLGMSIHFFKFKDPQEIY